MESENSYLNREISDNVSDKGPVFDYSTPKLTEREEQILVNYLKKLDELKNLNQKTK